MRSKVEEVTQVNQVSQSFPLDTWVNFAYDTQNFALDLTKMPKAIGIGSQYNKTLKDFAKILGLFDNSVEEISIVDVSRALDMSFTKVSRMLSTLTGESFFERNPVTGKYRLGIRFLELGIIYASNFPLSKIIRPHIEMMARELNLISSWAILRGTRVMAIDRVENLSIDIAAHRIGFNLPIHSTAVGKILLSCLPEIELDKVLGSCQLAKLTERTIVDYEILKSHLRLCREKGYATDEGETHPDLNCIAAPIKDKTGTTIAALNLMGEKHRIPPADLFGHMDYLREKALFISRQLGFEF